MNCRPQNLSCQRNFVTSQGSRWIEILSQETCFLYYNFCNHRWVCNFLLAINLILHPFMFSKCSFFTFLLYHYFNWCFITKRTLRIVLDLMWILRFSLLMTIRYWNLMISYIQIHFFTQHYASKYGIIYSIYIIIF